MLSDRFYDILSSLLGYLGMGLVFAWIGIGDVSDIWRCELNIRIGPVTSMNINRYIVG